MEASDSTRLNKFIAHQTGLSRRQADELIESGRVKINDQTAIIGSRFKPGQSVTVDGNLLDGTNHSYTYLMLNKPVGYVCSRRAQGDSPTIYELLDDKQKDLKPAGRLDRDSSGLLILSDDGDFIFQMTHPKFHKNKSYEIRLNLPLQPLHRQMISDRGINLEDGVSKLALERIGDSDDGWRVVMHEGRNRQIRRTFAALGYEVGRLHRTDFGPYQLGDLSPGASKLINIR